MPFIDYKDRSGIGKKIFFYKKSEKEKEKEKETERERANCTVPKAKCWPLLSPFYLCS